jgi:hypothetical protein
LRNRDDAIALAREIARQRGKPKVTTRGKRR